MATVQLTRREQLILRIMRMPDEQVAELAALAEDLEEDLDPAMIEARKKESSITLDEYLRESGLTREELQANARAEGLIK
jgi:tetrahydromethanopterin S-methyltransferase subunit B